MVVVEGEPIRTKEIESAVRRDIEVGSIVGVDEIREEVEGTAS